MLDLWRRIRMLFHRAEFERDLEEEIQHHLAMLQDAGAPRRQFGNTTSLREESRAMWNFALLEHLRQDLRYAIRTMAASPLFTATAVLSLALGIGANTAIYSFIDAILLRNLPVLRPAELTVLEWHATRRPVLVQSIYGTSRSDGATGMTSPNFPYGAFDLFRADKTVFSTVFAYTFAAEFNVIVRGEAESLRGGYVSGNYFNGLGVPPAAGRLFTDDDDRSGAPPTVVLAFAYWQRRFHSDPAAIGQTMRINNLPFQVAGVTAPDFFGVDPQTKPDFFLPLHAMPAFAVKPADEERARFFNNGRYWIEMIGRLRPGVTIQQAQAAARARFRAYVGSFAENPKDAEVLPELFLDEAATGLGSLRRRYSQPLFVLMTMVGLILAIACANLANLLLARAAARRREIAVRLSLGASRGRIVRQMLTESVALSVTGGALGIAVAYAGIRFITWLLANGHEQFTLDATINWPVLAFTFALAVTAGVLFGLAPAIQSTNVDFTPALKENRLQGWRAYGKRFRPRLGQALIVVQIAVSLLLVIGAGLFVRTLSNLRAIDIGFHRENLLLVSVNGSQGGYRGEAQARYFANLLDRFRQIPGVRTATASNYPLVSRYMDNNGITIPGRTDLSPNASANILQVDPAFLETMGIPVLQGRDLQSGDMASPLVAVVNQKFASEFFHGENALGRQFAIGRASTLVQIIGVAKTVRYNSLTEKDQTVVYVPYTANPNGVNRLYFALRTAGPPFEIANAVRRIVHEVSPSVSLGEFTTQSQRIDETISQERTFANLATCFAVLALLIACVGLYGAMAYAVARRTGEIGLRMALGAQRWGIISMVLREVLALTIAGLAIGYAASRFTTRLLESFLYGVKPNDLLAIIAAITILLAAAIVAGYLPAWRASRIDPATALRNE